jgi:hypothetical protein
MNRESEIYKTREKKNLFFIIFLFFKTEKSKSAKEWFVFNIEGEGERREGTGRGTALAAHSRLYNMICGPRQQEASAKQLASLPSQTLREDRNGRTAWIGFQNAKESRFSSPLV